MQIGGIAALRHPQRLHRRGRLRDLGAGRRRRCARARAAGPARGQARRPGRAQFAAAGSRPVPLRQRHRHHHHAGRGLARTGRSRRCGAPAARAKAAFPAPQPRSLAQLHGTGALTRKRVGLVRWSACRCATAPSCESFEGQPIGQVTSGLLGPTVDQPVAMAYVAPALRRARHAHPGHRARQAGADGSEHHALRPAPLLPRLSTCFMDRPFPKETIHDRQVHQGPRVGPARGRRCRHRRHHRARAGRAGRRGVRRPAGGRQELRAGRGGRRGRVGEGRGRRVHARRAAR